MTVMPQLLGARDYRLAVARDRFFNRGELPEDCVSPLILRSWERCRGAGLDHSSGGAFDLAGRRQLDESRGQNAKLLETASGVMEHVFEQIRSSGSMVILADLDGMIIHSLGDAGFVNRAERVALQPGACWKESVRGTNGIGTALLEKGPIEIFGPEHYLDRNVFLTCCGSPIFDGHGRLAGAFDISGDCRNPQRHTLGLVRLSVQLLEKRLFESEFANDILIALHPSPEYLGSLQEGLIAVSPEGTIIGASPIARQWFANATDEADPSNVSDLFRIGFGSLIDKATSAVNGRIRVEMRRGGDAYVQVRSFRPLPRVSRVTHEADVRAKTPPTLDARRSDPSRGLVGLDALATGDECVQRAIDRAKRVGRKDIPLLIQGESGSGKEIFARAFHNGTARADGPFVPINCAAIPENLIESELFGYVGGAFTGARREGMIGKIQQADGGTLFLDEIGDMPLLMQTRLLRVLQERSVTPVGSHKSIPVDFSLVCATHCVLREAVAKGEFREDLYYRINGLTVTLPLLRERTDISTIANRLLEIEIADSEDRPITISREVMAFFETFPWPGNIRQLHSVIRVAVALLDDAETEIRPEHLPEELFHPVADGDQHGRHDAALDPQPVRALESPSEARAVRSLDEAELEVIEAVMKDVKGNVSAAARRLGLSRNTLYRKLGRMH